MINSLLQRSLSALPQIAKISVQSRTALFTKNQFTIIRMSSSGKNDPKDQRMIWVDCEMTGLDIEKDKLIEIAVVVTDKDLNILAQGE